MAAFRALRLGDALRSHGAHMGFFHCSVDCRMGLSYGPRMRRRRYPSYFVCITGALGSAACATEAASNPEVAASSSAPEGAENESSGVDATDGAGSSALSPPPLATSGAPTGTTEENSSSSEDSDQDGANGGQDGATMGGTPGGDPPASEAPNSDAGTGGTTSTADASGPSPNPTMGADAGSGGGAEGTADGPALVPPSLFDAYWTFDTQTNGAVPDLTGNGFTLELEATDLQAGLAGASLNLSGVGSHGSTAAPPVNTSESFSVSAWVRLDVSDEFNTMVAQDGDQVSAFYLQKRADGRLSFTTFPEDSTSASVCVTSGEIEPRAGEWYHVVGTRDAASREQRLYVDGVLSGKVTCTSDVFAASGGLSVGRAKYDGAAADWMTGSVDELGVVARVLTPGQVFDLYRAGRPEARHYLFAYFIEVGQGRGDGLRLAHSHDGYHWGAIGAGKVFMPPSAGGGSFRDPHLLLDPSGHYHLVWTTSCVPWAESNCVQDRGFGHASSTNLVDWSAADYVDIDLNVEHVWAPETFYDEDSSQFMVFWSSPLDADPSASDPHSIYYLLTTDFKSHSEPAVLYSQPGGNFIDATIRRHGDEYLMVIKDEAEGQKNLRAITSPRLHGAGAWQGTPSAPLTGDYAAEGPSLLERDGELYLYFDKYGEGAYGALRASTGSSLVQPASWDDISASIFFPGVRHGTPIEVGWDVFRQVALRAGE